MVQGHFKDKALFSIIGWGLFLTLVCLGNVGFSSSAHANDKYASLVMDADTGMILHERYADKKLHPASLTKIMTLLMAFEALEQGKMNYNTRIRISSHAASMVPSKLGLKPGSSITAKDAINILVTKSANDIAVAMAEHLGRTESSFAEIMTRKARHIGMKSTTFRNASGLPDPKQVTTARDMALLAQYVINKYPQYYKFYNQTSVRYGGQTYRNHNKLLGSYKGMDGMKTGYVRASGFNLVASAVRNNQRIIGVVFGGRSGNTRNAHMETLLDDAFAKMQHLRIAESKVPLPPRKPVALLAFNARGGHEAEYISASNPQIAEMGRLIGEGDYDLDKIRRVETGMIAMAAHTGQQKQIAALAAKQAEIRAAQQQQQAGVRYASVQPSVSAQQLNPALSARHQQGQTANNAWSVQIGAFSSRAATDELLNKSVQKLPRASYNNVHTIVAPLKTQDGWLFRGRLAGMTRTQALAACQYFSDCMPIAPNNQ